MFSWDNKLAGARVLLSRVTNTSCSVLPLVPDTKIHSAHSLTNSFLFILCASEQRALLNKDKRLDSFTGQAEDFICRVLPKSISPSSTTAYTPGGLMHRSDDANLQYVASASFLLTTYAKYMAASKREAMSCQNVAVTYKALRALANRLVGILHGCLRHHQTYNEATAWASQTATTTLAA